MLRLNGRQGLLHLLFFLALSLFGLSAGVYVRVAQGGKIGGVLTLPFTRPAFEGKKQFTILLLGLDQKDRLNPHSPQRADSILLLKVDLIEKNLKGLSIPRDSLVTIPGLNREDKINSAYAYGGVDLMKQTVTMLTGVPVDYYVVSEVAGFEKLVNLVGGIEIEVEKDMDYDDNWQDLHIHLKKGFQHLNGKEAMGYVRFRHDAQGDMGRMARQQKFFIALAQKALSPVNWPKLPQLIREARKAVDTNLLAPDLLYLAHTFRDLKPEDVQLETLPGTPGRVRGISYWIIDEEKAKETIAQLFDVAEIATSATVEVLNATGRKGMARQAAQTLENTGFTIRRIALAEGGVIGTSRIYYRNGNQEGAEEVLRLLGVGELIPVSEGESWPGRYRSDIVVFLGQDYLLLQSP